MILEVNLERSGIHHMAQNAGEIVYVKKKYEETKEKDASQFQHF